MSKSLSQINASMAHKKEQEKEPRLKPIGIKYKFKERLLSRICG